MDISLRQTQIFIRALTYVVIGSIWWLMLSDPNRSHFATYVFTALVAGCLLLFLQWVLALKANVLSAAVVAWCLFQMSYVFGWWPLAVVHELLVLLLLWHVCCGVFFDNENQFGRGWQFWGVYVLPVSVILFWIALA